MRYSRFVSALTLLSAVCCLSACRTDNHKVDDALTYGLYAHTEGHLTPENLGYLLAGEVVQLDLSNEYKVQFYCDESFLEEAWPYESPIRGVEDVGVGPLGLSFAAALRVTRLTEGLSSWCVYLGSESEVQPERQYSPTQTKQLVEATTAPFIILAGGNLNDAYLTETAKAGNLQQVTRLYLFAGRISVNGVKALVDACPNLQELAVIQRDSECIAPEEAAKLLREGMALFVMLNDSITFKSGVEEKGEE